MLHVQYDPEVVQEFASRLYARARSIVRKFTALGVLVGGFVGLAAGQAAEAGMIGLGIGAFIGGALGAAIGDERAFTLKLQAQQALCQLQIEANTRPRERAIRAAE